MDDLISRKYLRNRITKLVLEKGKKVSMKDILYEIENAPVTFDNDKVLRQLKELNDTVFLKNGGDSVKICRAKLKVSLEECGATDCGDCAYNKSKIIIQSGGNFKFGEYIKEKKPEPEPGRPWNEWEPGCQEWPSS